MNERATVIVVILGFIGFVCGLFSAGIPLGSLALGLLLGATGMQLVNLTAMLIVDFYRGRRRL